MKVSEKTDKKIAKLQAATAANKEAVEKLEQKLCNYADVPHCVCVESATSGMLMALKAIGIGEGDTVLATSFSYFALSEIIWLAGAKTVLVDINPNTYTVDTYCLEYLINKFIKKSLPLPKALIAVDLFGAPCDYETLGKICDQHGIFLIEDMAQSFGATVKGKKTGSFGHMAIASFYQPKLLSESGEGGAVFCHSAQDAALLYELREKICLHRKLPYQSGGDMNAEQISRANFKLSQLQNDLHSRREIAAYYHSRLKNIVGMQYIPDDNQSAYTQFAISLSSIELRNKLLKYLHESSIPGQVLTPMPIHSNSIGTQDEKIAVVNARGVIKKMLTIPINSQLPLLTAEYICDCLIQGIQWQG